MPNELAALRLMLGLLTSLPFWTSPPSAAFELPMSKKSPLVPATAPALLAASDSGPPAATLPAVSRLVLTRFF